MNRKLSSLFGASLALLCFVCHGTSVQAQADNFGLEAYRCCTVNLPTERDECDYRCAGYGHCGWYQRSFGSNYSFAGFCGNYVQTIGPFGCRPNCLPGQRNVDGPCFPKLFRCKASACSCPVPNYVGATSSGAVMAGPSSVTPTPAVAVPVPVYNAPSTPTPIPATPAPTTEPAKSGI